MAYTDVNIKDTPTVRLWNPANPSSISLSYEGNSLREIAGRIGKGEQNGIELNMEVAISLIQFSVKLDIFKKKEIRILQL